MQHTVIALMQDRPGVLNRAVSLFRRRGFNIDSLTVATTELAGLSRMTLVVNEDDVEQTVRQLERLVDVVAVHDVTHDRSVAQEMCLVRLPPPGARLGELLEIAREHDARVVDAGDEAMMLALMESPARVSAFLECVRPFGIEELTRSGRIAMTVGALPRATRRPGAPHPTHPMEPGSAAPFNWQADGVGADEAADAA
jgi:acetolactate synthase I/III small subunit